MKLKRNFRDLSLCMCSSFCFVIVISLNTKRLNFFLMRNTESLKNSIVVQF